VKVVASVALAVVLVVGLPVSAGAAEAHPGVGTVFDVRTFGDGGDPGHIDDRFQGGPTWDKPCEIDNEVTGATQRLTILQPDTCDPHTTGAPRAGSVPMARTFAASAGESYLSYAYARVQSPKGQFVAQVHLVARNGSGILRDCGGGGSTVGQPTADFVRLSTGVCTLPAGTSALTVEFAAVARAAGASGTAVVGRFQLLRCATSSASCPTTVPTTAPPPTAAPTTAPPVGDDGGGGSVEDPGTVPVPGDVVAPDVTTSTTPELSVVMPTSTTRRGDAETLSPIAGDQPDDGGGGNGTMLVVVAVLAVAVAVGTAAGWWAWRRD
jgi:hypothetical protein